MEQTPTDIVKLFPSFIPPTGTGVSLLTPCMYKTPGPLHCGVELGKPHTPLQQCSDAIGNVYKGTLMKSKNLSGDGAASLVACGLSSERKIITGKV